MIKIEYKTKIYRAFVIILIAISIIEATYIYLLKREMENTLSRAVYYGNSENIEVNFTISKDFYEYKNELAARNLDITNKSIDSVNNGDIFIWGEVRLFSSTEIETFDECGISINNGNEGLYTELIRIKSEGPIEVLFFSYEGFNIRSTNKFEECLVILDGNKYKVELMQME
ncbi:MAG: hypothetical protein PUD43_09120 [Clostridia bacterium]|nr:hypothetical protein [Clostridia bacterium]